MQRMEAGIGCTLRRLDSTLARMKQPASTFPLRSSTRAWKAPRSNALYSSCRYWSHQYRPASQLAATKRNQLPIFGSPGVCFLFMTGCLKNGRPVGTADGSPDEEG